jgi:hypothetical protein
VRVLREGFCEGQGACAEGGRVLREDRVHDGREGPRLPREGPVSPTETSFKPVPYRSSCS